MFLPLLRIRTLLVTCALASAVFSPAQAQERPPEPPGGAPARMKHHELPMPAFLHGIALNEVQRDEIFTILHEQAPTLRKQEKTIQATRAALQKLSLSRQFDETAARTLAGSLARETTGLLLLRAQSEQKIYATLTAEQQQQATEMARHRHGDMPPPRQHSMPSPHAF